MWSSHLIIAQKKMFPGNSKAQSIHINPVFKDEVLQKIRNKCEEPLQAAPIPSSAHINPRFINASNAKAKTIYMNPEFLNANFKPLNQDVIEKTNALIPKIETEAKQLPKVTQLNEIISKSRTRIIREHAQQQRPNQASAPKSNSPILLLTKRKLVRATTVPTSAIPPIVKKDATKRVLCFKLDNKSYTIKRTAASAIVKRRPASSFVARYALRRCGGSTKLGTLKTARGAASTATAVTLSRHLRLININGIFYRSSQNKLQRKIENSTKPTPNNASKAVVKDTKIANTNRTKGRTVYVRGTKFVLDPQGFKLTRVTPTAANAMSPFSTAKSISKTARTSVAGGIGVCQPRRIDIGGHTYVASSSNVFVRTSTHLVLAHLNQAKQRSVSVLSRCLRKVNKPCIIFQRLGKCAAFERNRCSKIHDKQQVIVCPKFLQGACINPNCLLSHNKTYQKMPVCKFFLQGCCVRGDCPYLHKKLSEGSDLCENFRRGFCVLGEKCNKQHIFPEAKSKQPTNATQGVPKAQHQQRMLSDGREHSHSPAEENAMTSRYFSDECFILGLSKIYLTKTADSAKTVPENEEPVNNSNSSNSHNEEIGDGDNDVDGNDEDNNVKSEPTQRKPLGSLPAFIPLS